MRGQRAVPRFHAPSRRIIPARAGPTLAWPEFTQPSEDHPRSCGANFLQFGNDGFDLGSSPLVRGQHAVRGKHRLPGRIIPARAGPTLCLEYDKIMHYGSSPLVRGQRGENVAAKHMYRIIPARAGPTIPLCRHMTYRPDHPRSCGANSLILRGKSGLSQIKIFDYSSGIWQ